MKWKRLARCIAVSCAASAVGFTAAVYASFCPGWNPDLVSKVLFHPFGRDMVPNPMLKIGGISGKQIVFDAPGDSANHALNAWFYQLPSAKKVVLLSHGNAGNVMHRATKIKRLLSCGQSVFAYDYEGYGVSEGTPSPNAVAADVCAAFDYLVNQLHYDPANVIAYGESIGCGATAELLQRRHPGAVVLESGFTSIERLGKERFSFFQIYPSMFWFKPSLNTLEAVKMTHVPLLVIHGMHDEVIPFHHAQEVFAAASSPKKLVLLPHCKHGDQSPDEGLYLSALREFLTPAAIDVSVER